MLEVFDFYLNRAILIDMEVTTYNLTETYKQAEIFLAHLIKVRPNIKSTQATVVLLSGDLGAGKTSFTQGLALALGVKDNVTSPTFVIEKIYPLTTTTSQPFINLVHIDCYRLNSSEDLKKIGIEKILATKNNLVVVEWPEQAPNLWPKEAKEVKLTFINDTTRNISYDDQEKN